MGLGVTPSSLGVWVMTSGKSQLFKCLLPHVRVSNLGPQAA